MELIKISRDKYAMVDDDIADIVAKYKWSVWPTSSGDFYAIRHNGDKCEFMHHYVIGFPMCNTVVDHINHNGLDNRRNNLRIITQQQNSLNRRSSSISNFPGVYKCRDKWQVKFTINGKNIRCGTFNSILEAFYTYRNTMLKYGRSLLPEHEIKYNLLKSLNCFEEFQQCK